MSKKSRVILYNDFSDDFYPCKTKYQLPQNYKWIRKDPLSVAFSFFVYSLAVLFSNIYCRLFLHTRVKGAKKIRKNKGGLFLYGNHTQPVGDVFTPALICFPKRIYTIVNTDNYALPVIGKILPYLGALPITDTLSGMKRFDSAVKERVEGGHPVIIYPEAHVWDYYTKIRPFDSSSFAFPVKNDMPAYCMTATYQKRKFFKKPKITVYIDGPFTALGETKKEKAKSLCEQIYNCMNARSKLSDYEYIKYIKKDS